MRENVYNFELHLSIINETRTGFTFKKQVILIHVNPNDEMAEVI